MKTHIIKILFLITSVLFSPSLFAKEKAVIIVSESVDLSKISKNDLQNIFLGKQTLWKDGKRIQISLSNEDEKLLDDFLANSVGKTKRRYKKYWLKKVFSGYGIAPKIFTNNTKTIQFVQEREHAIAFVTIDDSQSIEGMKVLNIEGQNYLN